MTSDPFGTAELRESVLASWRDSPTRFREDANAEDDLRVGGYRDRLLVELAQNAADAAADAGLPGSLWLRIVDTPTGPELRAANTGTALDAAGVAALASLRASAKRAGHQVGRFGLGFASVRTVSEAPRVISESGGVLFSADLTRMAIADHAHLVAVLAERDAEVPVLRLVWPAVPDEEPVPDGFTTDVRLPLRAGVDPAELLERAVADAPDLLLALPGLSSIIIGTDRWEREDAPDGGLRIKGPAGISTWLTWRAAGTLEPEQTGALGIEARARPEWTVCWAVRLANNDTNGLTNSGGPVAPTDGSVLHAPTPTDERLSLPALLSATLPLEPNRRRVLPGPATDAVLAAAIAGYVGLIQRLPGPHRTALVPRPGFPLSEVDAQLRDGIAAALGVAAWLPAQRPDAPDIAPARAVCLEVPDDELAGLLADVIPGLVASWLAESVHAKALAALGVRRLRPADIIAAVSSVDRSPSWWATLYSALTRLPDPGAALTEELGGLPVPLIDGRLAIGPRDVLLPSPELGDLMTGVDVAGLRIAHPAARHPLLERLGAQPAGPMDLLTAPAIRDAVGRSVPDAMAGLDVGELAGMVLRLVAAARIAPGELPWLAALALPDSTGELRQADELILPDAPLLTVLSDDILEPDGPLGVLADEWAADWPADVLRAVGVLDTFAVVIDENPTGPDHDLADEADWWAWTIGDDFGTDLPPEPPSVLIGIRDLDLVDPDAWPIALRLLAARPETARALTDPAGYAAWWLARYAMLDGRSLREWRTAGAVELAGLYDPIPDIGLPDDLLIRLGVRHRLTVADADQAEDLLERLGDPDRTIPLGLAFAAHAELAGAALREVFDPADVDPPNRVRVLTGATAPAEQTMVLDRPWLVPVLPAERVLAARTAARPSPGQRGSVDPDRPDPRLDAALADLLNVPLASDRVPSAIESAGDEVDWAELGAVQVACGLLGVSPPAGTVVVHDDLVVDGHRVPWWVVVDDAAQGMQANEIHAEDTPDGLARALAWAIDRWPDRWELAALIGDPTPTTHLG